MLGALFPFLFALAFTHHLLAGYMAHSHISLNANYQIYRVSADHFLYSVVSALIAVGQFTQEHLGKCNRRCAQCG